MAVLGAMDGVSLISACATDAVHVRDRGDVASESGVERSVGRCQVPEQRKG